MGGGTYILSARTVRATKSGYYNKSSEEIFESRNMPEEMNPKGVKVRESRDSDEHPESVAIIIGLDGTGSMGHIPRDLIQNGFPDIMKKIMDNGIKDPQVMFAVIGDHECDNAPLQVGQFESSDELLDKWLTKGWLEGDGGGNNGESYPLVWYFAGKHTAIDCLEKRGKKGILITIGDEPYLRTYPGSKPSQRHRRDHHLKSIMGGGQFNESYTAEELLKMASEKYAVYHVHTCDTYHGQNVSVKDGWKQLLGDNFMTAQGYEMIPDMIADTVLKHFKKDGQVQIPEPVESVTPDKTETEEEIVL